MRKSTLLAVSLLLSIVSFGQKSLEIANELLGKKFSGYESVLDEREVLYLKHTENAKTIDISIIIGEDSSLYELSSVGTIAGRNKKIVKIRFYYNHELNGHLVELLRSMKTENYGTVNRGKYRTYLEVSDY